MLDTTLAIRYARALHKITLAKGNVKKVSLELAEFHNLIESSRDLKRVLFHPGITADEKKTIVSELLHHKADETTIRFINYIIGKKRIFQLGAISKCFTLLLADDENRINVKVECFKPLSDDLQKKIKDHLTSMLKKDIDIVTEVQPSLLGGIRLTLGDKVIDGSISNQLKKLTQIVTAV